MFDGSGTSLQAYLLPSKSTVSRQSEACWHVTVQYAPLAPAARFMQVVPSGHATPSWQPGMAQKPRGQDRHEPSGQPSFLQTAAVLQAMPM